MDEGGIFFFGLWSLTHHLAALCQSHSDNVFRYNTAQRASYNNLCHVWMSSLSPVNSLTLNLTVWHGRENAGVFLCFLDLKGKHADILEKDDITDGKRAQKRFKTLLTTKKIRNKGLILELYSDALTNSFLFSFFFVWKRPGDHLGAAEDLLHRCRHMCKHCDISLRHRTATLKEGEEHFSMQERYVYCSFICSHAVRHTRKLLRSLGNNWHEKPVADMSGCLQCGVRADTWACVSLYMCMKAFSVYPAWFCFCQCVRVHIHEFIMHWSPGVTCQDTDVRKLRHSESDKQTMPGGGPKQCSAIALLLSVCPRCHVTEIFSTIKAFSMVQACVRVCVCSGRGSLVTGYIGHAQTKPNTQQEPQAIRPAIEHNSLNTLWFPLTIY